MLRSIQSLEKRRQFVFQNTGAIIPRRAFKYSTTAVFFESTFKISNHGAMQLREVISNKCLYAIK